MRACVCVCAGGFDNRWLVTSARCVRSVERNCRPTNAAAIQKNRARVSVAQKSDMEGRNRVGRLTASNAGAALGLCAFTSRQQAFNRAIGVERRLAKEFDDAVGRTRVTKAQPMHAFYRAMGRTGSDATRWGTTHESDGVAAYAAHTGNAVQKAGLRVHPSCPWLAGAPDGIIGTEGLLEVKCPFWFKADGTRLHRTISASYYMQIQLCLEICARKWCDFVSWTPEGNVVYRVTRDGDLHRAMAGHYGRFCAAMQQMAHGPPALSGDEQADIRRRVSLSMAAHVDYSTPPKVENSTRYRCPPVQQDQLF